MQTKTLTFLLTVFSLAASASETPCPKAHPETIENTCEQEQGRVMKALKGLQPHSMRIYCGQNPGKDYACRALVRYLSPTGELSEDIFEEWFITNPQITPVKQWRGFYVKRDDQLYDIYWADEVDGTYTDEFQITSADPQQTNMAVEFEGLYPRFDIHYNFVDKSKQAVRGFYTYSENQVQIDKYNTSKDGTQTPIETLYYHLTDVLQPSSGAL